MVLFIVNTSAHEILAASALAHYVFTSPPFKKVHVIFDHLLRLTRLTKNGNKKIPASDHTKKAVPLLCGHGVWGSGSTGDSGAMACRAVLFTSVLK